MQKQCLGNHSDIQLGLPLMIYARIFYSYLERCNHNVQFHTHERGGMGKMVGKGLRHLEEWVGMVGGISVAP